MQKDTDSFAKTSDFFAKTSNLFAATYDFLRTWSRQVFVTPHIVGWKVKKSFSAKLGWWLLGWAFGQVTFAIVQGVGVVLDRSDKVSKLSWFW